MLYTNPQTFKKINDMEMSEEEEDSEADKPKGPKFLMALKSKKFKKHKVRKGKRNYPQSKTMKRLRRLFGALLQDPEVKRNEASRGGFPLKKDKIPFSYLSSRIAEGLKGYPKRPKLSLQFNSEWFRILFEDYYEELKKQIGRSFTKGKQENSQKCSKNPKNK